MSASISTFIANKKLSSSDFKLADFTPAFKKRLNKSSNVVTDLGASYVSDTIVDVNELNELRERNTELSHLVDVLPNGVVVLDNKGRVSQANKSAIALLGEPLEGEQWRTIIGR